MVEGFARARPELVRVVVILGGGRAAPEVAPQDLRHAHALRGGALVDPIVGVRRDAEADRNGRPGTAAGEGRPTVGAWVVAHDRQYARRGPSPATRGSAGQGERRRRRPHRHQSPTAAPASQ